MTFRSGQQVRVAARTPAGHHRTPGYVKGKVGTIERLHGSFTNPETRAYGGDGLPEQSLYSVSFRRRDLWPQRGGGVDRVYVDVFEQWLQAVE